MARVAIECEIEFPVGMERYGVDALLVLLEWGLEEEDWFL